MNHSCSKKKYPVTVILLLCIAALCSCTDANKTADGRTKCVIKAVTSVRQLNKITAKAKDRLLMFVFFEGCVSCHMLLAQLEGVAREQKDKVAIFKIDVTKNPKIAKTFNVSKLPYVVCVKNQKEVHAIAGIQPRNTFIDAIDQYAD